MNRDVEINGFNELVDYLRTSDLDKKQTADVIGRACKVWFVSTNTKEELIEGLVRYWDKWGSTRERPLFADWNEKA